jgi:hypothetical protein
MDDGNMDLVIAAKIVIGVVGIGTALALASSSTVLALSKRNFDRILYGIAITSRFGLFILVYVILGFQTQSDALIYYHWSHSVLAGGVPGESDILPLHHGPLFLYLTAAPLLLVDAANTIVVLAITAELISIPIWLAVARTAVSEIVARRAMLLYVASPFSVLTSVLGANNDVVASMFVAAGMWLFLTKKQLWSAVTLGVGVVCSKLLVVAAAPPLLFRARHPLAWGTALAAVPTVGYGAWVLMGIDPIEGIRFHAQDSSSGNIPFLLGFLHIDLMNGTARIVTNTIGVILIGGILALALFRRSDFSNECMLAFFGALFAAFMLASAKSWAHYWIIAFVPTLCVLAANGWNRWLITWYSLFSFTTSVESTLWWRVGLDKHTGDTHHPGTVGLFLFLDGTVGLFLFLVETLLIASYVMVLLYCGRRLIRMRRQAVAIYQR